MCITYFTASQACNKTSCALTFIPTLHVIGSGPLSLLAEQAELFQDSGELCLRIAWMETRRAKKGNAPTRKHADTETRSRTTCKGKVSKTKSKMRTKNALLVTKFCTQANLTLRLVWRCLRSPIVLPMHP